MSTDLLHTEKPSLIVTQVAYGAVSARHFVNFDGAQCSTLGEGASGVSRDNAANGQPIEVTGAGTALVVAGESLLVGKRVTSDASGHAVVCRKKNHYVNGIVARAQATPGQDVEIRINPTPQLFEGTTTTTTTTSTSTTTTTTTSTSTTTTAA